MKITADFKRITGKIKPMHAIGQPPNYGARDNLMHYVGEAGLPYSRLHDAGGPYGGARYVDIPNVFPDFSADENNPESYDFVFTDWLITALMKQGCEPFYRLGVTIENFYKMKPYRIYPPEDFGKWARICEHIIRHYNEGWADGFNYNIRYWEIWNEPEGGSDKKGGAMWLGTAEQYLELYEITARHLKNCFGDSIKVGGYASCGFDIPESDPELTGIPDVVAENWGTHLYQYAHQFFKYISERNVPIDFFSWHCYGDPQRVLSRADSTRRVMEKYGFGDVEDICNEWNPTPDPVRRSTAAAAAKVSAVMLGMQKKKTWMLNFYDARIGSSQYGGIFDPNTWYPYKSYYTLMSFNRAYRLGNEVFTESDDANLYVCGAVSDDGGKAVLLVTNTGSSAAQVEFDLSGVDISDAEILFIDDCYTYTPTGKRIVDGKLTLSPNCCAEIRF